jgi:hypothetical protein
MPLPVLEFFSSDWIAIPAQLKSIQFRIVAKPPVSANVGVTVFAKPTHPQNGQNANFAQIGKTSIDNIPETIAGTGFSLPVQAGVDYVVRIQGEAHLLMPGFQEISVGFNISHASGPISNLEGDQTVAGRAAGIVGDVYLRCA